ncbi:hypothetical protein I5U28_03610 [Stenotrophomonas maltophilia]|nr:hypothetical protein [Stenotrophomonas maltophilia]MCI1053660.1 hypothetical protein [Stenotrophomonas maltophilia]
MDVVLDSQLIRDSQQQGVGLGNRLNLARQVDQPVRQRRAFGSQSPSPGTPPKEAEALRADLRSTHDVAWKLPSGQDAHSNLQTFDIAATSLANGEYREECFERLVFVDI